MLERIHAKLIMVVFLWGRVASRTLRFCHYCEVFGTVGTETEFPAKVKKTRGIASN